VLQLARSERFRTVNIVRRRAQAPDIKALGGEVVISSEDNDWGTQLATASTGKALSRAIDCVAGRIGATVARHLAPCGRMLVYGALSSHRQTDPSAFEMPVFAPRLIYSAAAVQGWYLLHWLEVTPLAECGASAPDVCRSGRSCATFSERCHFEPMEEIPALHSRRTVNQPRCEDWHLKCRRIGLPVGRQCP